MEFHPTYVISAAWASFANLAEMQTVLRLGKLGLVADNLEASWCTNLGEGSYRLAEVETWFATHPNSGPFMIIDDPQGGASTRGSVLEQNTVFCAEFSMFDDNALQQSRWILLHQLQHNQERNFVILADAIR